MDADTKQVTSYAKTIETASLEEQATDAKEIAGYLTKVIDYCKRSKLHKSLKPCQRTYGNRMPL